MKHTILIALLLPFTAFAADEFTLDPTHTYPNFSISHLGFSVMHGRFNESSGTVVMDRDGGASSVKVTVKTASIDTGMDKRDDHLRKPEFLDVAKFPEMMFESTKVSFTGKDTAKVEGKLTLHGVTKPLTLDVTKIVCNVHPMKKNYVCGFDAKASLKRSDFGVAGYLPAIGDEVEIRISAEGERKEKTGGPPRG